MTETPLYQTNLAPRARRGMMLNALAGAVLALLSGSQWFVGGHWLQGLIFFIIAPVVVFIVVTLIRSRHPLQIFGDHIMLNSVISTALPLAGISGIGTHPRRGEPSLTCTDTASGQTTEVTIPWRFIAEPRDDVLAQLNIALGKDAA